MFRFLDLNMCNQPYYPEVLERVKNGEKILDIGCCFGQELRKLVSQSMHPSLIISLLCPCAFDFSTIRALRFQPPAMSRNNSSTQTPYSSCL